MIGRLGTLGIYPYQRKTRWFGETYAASGFDHTAVPTKAPMPAVIAIANAPQNVMRRALGTIGAPPTRAANAPKNTRKSKEAPDTVTIIVVQGAKRVITRGIAAPTAKLLADAKAA